MRRKMVTYHHGVKHNLRVGDLVHIDENWRELKPYVGMIRSIDSFGNLQVSRRRGTKMWSRTSMSYMPSEVRRV